MIPHTKLRKASPANQKLVQHVLGTRGHQLILAHNVQEAVDLVDPHSVDVVLMDVQMPEMDGFEAIRRVRQSANPAKAQVPVIAMTAHALKGDQEKCLAAGMDAYLSKPIKALKLIELVEQWGNRTS